MLIPSIDLLDGKVVQLVQGKQKALEFEDAEPWVSRFSGYPMVQLIDLNAALGTGSNARLVEKIAGRLSCQVGGGIRSHSAARTMLEAGAQRVIVASALFSGGRIDRPFAESLAGAVGPDRLVFALDAVGGRVAIHGWKQRTEVSPLEMLQALEAYCAAFLYTHVDTEGSLQGFPLEVIHPLRQATARGLIAAGGIRSQAEVEALQAIQVDAVVGMAIYTGLLVA
jgi:phosphoribosylformimino-5-aminoimidazole carboxamide ribotide isomerase